jgi:1-deoxyxylulose-5-phosphate synthase
LKAIEQRGLLKMNMRELGNTGIEVSEISFGSVSLGIPYGIGVKDEADMPGETEAVRLLHSALDHGINFFDTARVYGRSESIFGKAFKGIRDRVVISTKCSSVFDEDGKLPEGRRLRSKIDESLRKSLDKLQTNYVDVLLLHSVNSEVLKSEEIVHIFSEYKRQGLIKASGVSTYGAIETQKAIESGNWDVIQLAYNLFDQQEAVTFPMAAENGVGIMVRSVLFKGILTDRGRDLNENLAHITVHREVYNELLSETGLTMSELATKFVLSHDEVSSVLVGIDKMEYLDAAIAVADGNYLDEQTLTRASELGYPDPDELDLQEWDRKGWL